MMISIARRIAALLAFLAIALPASATSNGIDYTDIWWGGQAESGWGVNLMQQGTFIFATIFIYGTDQKPTWYTGQLESGGTTTFTGPLFATTGPYFGAGSFNPASVTATQVGTMTVNFTSGYNGSLSYTVNGVTVNKSIVRQFLKNNTLAGNYMGGQAATGSNCGSGVTNGAVFINGGLVVTQTGTNVSMAVSFYNVSGLPTVCTYSGVLVPQGALGQIANGAFSCNVNGSSANAGSFNLDTISITQSGFSGVFTGKDQYCTYNGWFGGVRAPG